MAVTTLAAAIAPSHAQPSFGPPNVEATIDVETERPVPGSTVTVALAMKPSVGWHDYWINPADAGTPLELQWDLPKGVTASEYRAPVPKTLLASGFMNYVYERPHAFLIDLKIADSIPVGTPLTVKVAAAWSACSDRVCVPEGDEFTLNLVAGEGTAEDAVTEPDRRRFDRYRQDIPPMIAATGKFTRESQKISFAIPYPASAPLTDPYFFPIAGNIIDHSATQSARRKGDYVIITAPASALMKAAPENITGLLHTAEGEGIMLKLQAGDIPAGGEAIATLGGSISEQRTEESPSLWLTIGAAILGGLLLNLMPCVFPILGLKAISLAKMGGGEKAARQDALAYSAGVILSCLALGLILLSLRAAGEQVGWAFQLQEPVIVMLLLFLLVAITANLAGVFEMNISVGSSASGGGSRDGGLGSFGTGVLAAIIATPCTGPFMAAALGAALLLPALQALLLFVALGFGLALPYLAIAYVPALRKRMPKPGTWMVTFRKIMAVPMLLTAVALLWLLWRLSGLTGLAIGLVGSILLIIAFVAIRRKQKGGHGVMIPAISALAITIAAALVIPKNAIVREQTADPEAILASQPFNETRLAEYRSNGRAVFVYFTADWCFTCKVNEAAAIQRQATVDAFAAKNIAVLKGDFTTKDPKMARILASYASAGVPLYLWFAPGKEAEKLPQLLTPSTLSELE